MAAGGAVMMEGRNGGGGLVSGQALWRREHEVVGVLWVAVCNPRVLPPPRPVQQGNRSTGHLVAPRRVCDRNGCLCTAARGVAA